MNRFAGFFLLFSSIMGIRSFSQPWAPRPAGLTTSWGEHIHQGNAWTSYPRPQLVRSRWACLNGCWKYCVTDSTALHPGAFDSTILVPYPIESALSGVKKPLLPSQRLWYQRTFEAVVRGKERLLLNFGAVDYAAKVYVNGHVVGQHRGGYEAFSVDITDGLRKGENELIVSVWDPTDKGNQPLGKQTLRPRTSFFTATSGIWQTVWLEWVPPQHITRLELVPDVDHQRLAIAVFTKFPPTDYEVEVEARTSAGTMAKKKLKNDDYYLPIPNMRLWSPADPFLYTLSVRLLQHGRIIDSVGSYFGMRKIAVQKDTQGYDRIYLNNQYLFQLGVLDQGFWPDGVYTAPSDSAFLFDIGTLREMGFNTIRKHLKVEPERWYFACDSLGMLVWQDMPCRYPGLSKAADDMESRLRVEQEMDTLVHQLYNHPSIVTWIPFNEDWAAYDTSRIRGLFKQWDPSRLVNTNSGSKIYSGPSGDFSVVHHYCYPVLPPRVDGKPMVLGEYGGVNVLVEGHQWKPGFSWGHGEVQNNAVDFASLYEDWIGRLMAFEQKGLSAAIFTQPYDCEHEACGLMTFDRKVFKIPVDTIRRIHERFWLSVTPAWAVPGDSRQ